MASSIPVMATNVGGIPDIIQDGKSGVLVPSGDVDQLILKFEELIADPHKRQELATNGFRLVKSNFSLEKMIESYRQVYREVLSGS